MSSINFNPAKKIRINNKSTGLKTVLRNSDLITLSIGANDIFYKLGLNMLNINLENKNI